MVSVDEHDQVVLQSVLLEHDMTGSVVLVERCGRIELTGPTFIDEQVVMDDLDFRGVGFSYSPTT